MERTLIIFQLVLLIYFAGIQFLSLLLSYRGVRHLWRSTREKPDSMLEDLAEQPIARPVSILVPAHNEGKTIIESVRSLSRLRFLNFEIIVISDGSTDDTVSLLEEEFGLEERPHLFARRLATKEITRILGGGELSNLTVVEKARGGKSDALNAGLNLAKYPLVCTVDADSLLESDALLRAARVFADDETVIAVGGTVRPLNGGHVEEGSVKSLALPRRWLERVQIVEYARSFFTSRVGWASWNALLLISGAFGVFRRESVLAIGGYRAETVGEDLDLVVRLHRHYRSEKIPYRILSLPDPMCWTQVPSDLTSLRSQRNRWQRGLWEILWSSKDMVLRPSYGRLGFLSLPYLWLFEGLAPLIEIFGYLVIPLSAFLGILSVEFAILFFILAVGFSLLTSVMGLAIEMLLENRYSSFKERLLLLVSAVVELFGVRQVLAFERLMAFFQVWSKRGEWGAMNRQQLGPKQGADPEAATTR